MTGDLFINNKDAWNEWRCNLQEGSVYTLLTPAPLKDLIESNIRTENGRRIHANYKTDYVSLTLLFHIIGKDLGDAYEKFGSLMSEISSGFTLKSRFINDKMDANGLARAIIEPNNMMINFHVDEIVYTDTAHYAYFFDWTDYDFEHTGSFFYVIKRNGYPQVRALPTDSCTVQQIYSKMVGNKGVVKFHFVEHAYPKIIFDEVVEPTPKQYNFVYQSCTPTSANDGVVKFSVKVLRNG